MMQVFTIFHEMRAERHEKGLIASGNGVHIREWSSMNAWCEGNRFPLITRNQLFSGKAIQERKGVLWAQVSPSITGTSNTPRCWDGSDAAEGLRDHMQSWCGSYLRFPLDMTLCDLVIWLPSSNTQSASKGLIIYSYAVRHFQEWFPSGILISTL